ncbi:MAG: 30S ribosomal protein S17 [Pseudomonadota bacterium]
MPKRVMEGVVVSTKGDKTAVVRVERTYMHPLYKKIVRRSKKYHAHDEDNTAQEGQTVAIIEAPARSKLKRWELVSGDAAAASDGGDA